MSTGMAALVTLTLILPCMAMAQALTCPKGHTPSCIARSTVCLDAMQCNSEGFVCKSQATGCARDLSALQSRFDSLTRDYDLLRQKADQATRENDFLRRQITVAENRARTLEDCILFATSVEDVRACP